MRILLLGANGFVGGALHERLRARHDVVAYASARRPGPFASVDLTDRIAVAGVASADVDLVVNAAGMVDLDEAERWPDLAYAVNVAAVETIVENARGRVVQFSSDNVFAGDENVYRETSVPDPVNVYGHTKLLAEQIVLSGSGNVVIRLPMLFGMSPSSTKFLDRLDAPVVEAPTDILANPVYLDDLVRRVEELWAFDGIVHFGGPDVVSRFDLLRRIVEALDLGTEVVPSTTPPDAMPRRPPHPILASERHDLVAMGFADAVAHMQELGNVVRGWRASR